MVGATGIEPVTGGRQAVTAAIVDITPARAIRNDLRRKWQDAFDDGARCAFLGEYPAEREPGGYPSS
jgi:hypothetical protein